MREDVVALATAAKSACRALAQLTRAQKDAVLLDMADALDGATETILAANAKDVQALREAGGSDALIDRLSLNATRINGIAGGLRQVAGLADPIGEVVRGSTLANGLEMRQVRVPFGVIAMVYEARPNVTVDAAGLCLKAGSAVLLRGSSSAWHSNSALVAVLQKVAAGHGLPQGSISLVPADNHDTVATLLALRGLVDVAIPRGGAKLISMVVETAKVPVIETGVGNCHLYVDADADLDMAMRILINGKTQRPSVCNALESLLVHQTQAAAFLPQAIKALQAEGVVVHGDSATSAFGDDVVPANHEDWAAEYLALEIAVRVVADLDEAVDHIREWGSGHTEAIVTRSHDAARRFVAGLDSAAIMINASTRFTDGEMFGFGAEIGISTQKLHARGPMGLQEITSTTYVVTGDGHIRP